MNNSLLNRIFRVIETHEDPKNMNFAIHDVILVL